MSFVERCRQRHRGSEGGDEGFTLIELLVVLLIIGILLAIAIPTFLSVTKGANNTAAQSNLQTALTGAKTFYTNSNQTFTGLTNSSAAATSSIQQIDTGLSYSSGAAGPSTGPHIIDTSVTSNGTVLAMVAFANGTNDCWGILDVTAAQTAVTDNVTGSKAVGTYFYVITGLTSSTTCLATTAATASSGTGFPHG
ncbi:MAG: prepilin-type N-terminal cleavage/methylation domain-containing protein [Acidimicrobiales bacterium]|jgi:type IV pilus assembly protein PilA